MSTATIQPAAPAAQPATPAAPAAHPQRVPTAVFVRARDLALRRASLIPTRQHPLRRVLRYSTPDARRPWLKDYVLVCGHRYPHVPLRRGADGRMHVAATMRCPLCAAGDQTCIRH